MTDVRRFAGYPVAGSDPTLAAGNDTVFVQFGMTSMSLYSRLTTLTSTEETLLTGVYLTNLTALEAAIPTASSNLDTDIAAVWTHNKQEVIDRTDLFDLWRRRMCSFLGLPPGPGLGGIGGMLGGGGNNMPVWRC